MRDYVLRNSPEDKVRRSFAEGAGNVVYDITTALLRGKQRAPTRTVGLHGDLADPETRPWDALLGRAKSGSEIDIQGIRFWRPPGGIPDHQMGSRWDPKGKMLR